MASALEGVFNGLAYLKGVFLSRSGLKRPQQRAFFSVFGLTDLSAVLRAQRASSCYSVGMKFHYQKLRDDAIAPKQGYAGDLGIDVCTPDAVTVPAGGSAVVDTGLRIQVPPVPEALAQDFLMGCFVWAKSGLSTRSHIEKGAGVIDPNYTGPLRIKLYNLGTEDVQFAPGNKIAQLVFSLCAKVEAVLESDLSEWQTERGERGFGSSGS